MKKNKTALIITLVLALAAAFFIFQSKKGTIRDELKDFAVSDTAAITKIFLADKKNNSVTLERKSASQWTVNGKYPVRPDGMQMILSTIKSMAVRTRVAKAAYNNVVKKLAAEGIKCEIYQNGDSVPMKVYYVGGSTADVLGTFMLLEKSDLPFIMEIPGFQGYLTPRYSPYEKDWRDKTVFDYRPEEIKTVSINYFQLPEKSFSIERIGNQFRVISPASGKTIEHVDTIGLVNYLSFFKYLCFEDWDHEFTDRQRDSLKSTTPLTTISVTDMLGTVKSITTFPKPITARSLAQSDSLGHPLKYDTDRLYAFTNEANEFVVIQYFVFGKLFRQLNDFDLDRHKSNPVARSK